jgi:uncharacterized membrane protein
MGGDVLRWINYIVDRLVEIFGGIWFIAIFNIITLIWIGLGLFDPYFFDPFPSNFYTLTVSWLAINMSSLVLWAERRSKAREERQRKKDADVIDAILHLSESNQRILQYLVERETKNRNGDDIT